MALNGTVGAAQSHVHMYTLHSSYVYISRTFSLPRTFAKHLGVGALVGAIGPVIHKEEEHYQMESNKQVPGMNMCVTHPISSSHRQPVSVSKHTRAS